MESTIKSIFEVNDKIKEMFNYKSKLRDRVPEEWIKRFKTTYTKLMEMIANGELPVHPDYLGNNELAVSIYRKKYFLKDLNGNLIEEKPEDVFVRISSFVAAVEKDDERALEWAVRFYNDLYEGLWLPGGRVLAGAGDLFRLKTLANCFSSMIENDSIEAIYTAAYEAARTYSYGGGIGIDLTPLRPAGAVVHNAADSSTGAVSFMELYSLTTGLIGQSGRRGALMLTLHVKHPDIFLFINVKSRPNWTTNQIIQQLKWTGKFSEEQLEAIKKAVMENIQVRFANISVKVTDEFMSAVEEQNKYGKTALLLYKKLKKGKVMEAFQDYKSLHYSHGIPSKNLKDYDFLGKFDTIEELNTFLTTNYKVTVDEEELKDPYRRDIYGDYVVELDNFEYDLAIRYAGDFLLYFGSKEVGSIKKLVKARDIWNAFVEGNYRTAEPGLMFWTKMVEYSPSNYIGRPIIGTNPCSEVPLEDGGACNLGSLNLSMFVKNPFTKKASLDWKKLKKAIENLVRFLDNVVSWNEYLNPLEKQRVAAKETRRVGMGIMGMADMFLKFGLAYDSEEALELLKKVMAYIANRAYEFSSKNAKEKGIFPLFEYDKYSKNPFFKEVIEEDVKKLIKKNGLRNVALLSIAPTGSISNIVKSFEIDGKNYVGVSGGIEPVFALFYTRRSESFGNKFFKVFHSTVQAYLDLNGLAEMAQEANEVETLKEILPDYFFRTAHEIEPSMRVKIQGIAQKYIDHSISSTVNLPEDINPEVISDIYIESWKNGLKGITIYREGSRYPILSREGQESEFAKFKDKKFKIKVNGKEVVLKGDDVIVLPNGKLTTLYHAIKDGIIGG